MEGYGQEQSDEGKFAVGYWFRGVRMAAVWPFLVMVGVIHVGIWIG